MADEFKKGMAMDEIKKIDNAVCMLECEFVSNSLLACEIAMAYNRGRDKEVCRIIPQIIDKYRTQSLKSREEAIKHELKKEKALGYRNYVFGRHKDKIELLKKNENLFSKGYVSFIEEVYDITRALNPLFIYNYAEYFKNPSKENLSKIQPEYKSVMAFRNQKKLLNAELFDYLKKQYDKYESKKKSGKRSYNLNIPSAMYRQESQVKAYSEAIESQVYNKSLEERLLMDIMPHIKKHEKVNIIGLGCGPGRHEIQFAFYYILHHDLNEKDVSLYLLDANDSMVNEAAASIGFENDGLIKNGRNPVNTLCQKIDFTKNELSKLSINHDNPSIYLFLGSTLGNFNNKTQIKILSNISKAMNEKDILVVGVKHPKFCLKDGIRSIDYDGMCGEYNETEEFAYKPLEILGISKENLGDYKIQLKTPARYVLDMKVGHFYTPRKITCTYLIKQDFVIDHSEDKIQFYKGDKIGIFFSERIESNKMEGLGIRANPPLIFNEMVGGYDDGYLLGICRRANKEDKIL
jgi:hypothetical protein